MNHKGTFGGSRAAEILDVIVNERNDPKLTKLLGKQIALFRKNIVAISDIQNLNIRIEIWNLYRKHYFAKIKTINFDKSVESHLLNYLSTLVKSLQRDLINKPFIDTVQNDGGFGKPTFLRMTKSKKHENIISNECPNDITRWPHGPAESPHTCPYNDDVNNEYGTGSECECCARCTEECAADI